jgi:hypothetical protein
MLSEHQLGLSLIQVLTQLLKMISHQLFGVIFYLMLITVEMQQQIRLNEQNFQFFYFHNLNPNDTYQF